MTTVSDFTGSVTVSKLHTLQPGWEVLGTDTTNLHRAMSQSPAFPHATSFAELLAIIIGGAQACDIATRVARAFPSAVELARANADEIREAAGVPLASAVRVKAALELGSRRSLPAERPTIRTPADAANLLMPTLGCRPVEEVWVLLLNARQQLITLAPVVVGGVNCASLSMAQLFQPATRWRARYVVVAHNHPSGDPTPSAEDARASRSMVEAGTLLGIEVLDHLVVAGGSWVSLKERGLGF